MTKKSAAKNTVDACEKLCMLKTPVVVRVSKFKLTNIGQGEGETKWKGWAWKLLLVKCVIAFIANYF